jgi:hypothetical protein
MSGIAFAWRYEGSGVWYDEAGKSQTYRRPNQYRDVRWLRGRLQHHFADATVVEARFAMTRIGPFLLRVDAAAKPLGNGYCFDGSCHYHIMAGQAVVGVSMRATSDALDVHGSSTKNAEGLYIACRESLRRTAPAG